MTYTEFKNIIEEFGRRPLEAFIEYFGECPDEDSFRDAYNGEWEDEEEFAYELVNNLGMLSEVPENLRYYFDYEAFAQDLFINDYVMEGRYVFNRNW